MEEKEKGKKRNQIEKEEKMEEKKKKTEIGNGTKFWEKR